MKKQDAILLAESGFWKQMSFDAIAKFQICEELLCMPFDIFQEAVEKTIRRPVFTHEFGLNYEGIKKEIFKTKELKK